MSNHLCCTYARECHIEAVAGGGWQALQQADALLADTPLELSEYQQPKFQPRQVSSRLFGRGPVMGCQS